MKPPKDDQTLAALAKALTAFYVEHNGFDPARGTFDLTIVNLIEHAMTYAFRIGYETRLGEEEGAAS